MPYLHGIAINSIWKNRTDSDGSVNCNNYRGRCRAGRTVRTNKSTELVNNYPKFTIACQGTLLSFTECYHPVKWSQFSSGNSDSKIRIVTIRDWAFIAFNKSLVIRILTNMNCASNTKQHIIRKTSDNCPRGFLGSRWARLHCCSYF
jgi:hypothetical protein